MMRRADSKSLSELKKLTRMRELAAREELARKTKALNAIVLEIEALLAQTYSLNSVMDGAVFGRWQVWRQQKLKQLMSKKATLAAAQRDAAVTCGRFIAENDVVESLKARSEKVEEGLRLRRSNYIS